MALVRNDFVSHEIIEAIRIEFGFDCRYQCSVPIQNPNFQEVLALLFKIISLQIVDQSNVVHKAPIIWDELVPISQAFFLEIFHQFIYKA